ncbi:MAG: PQQ-like beta-propeller repeat protein [Phycisphaerae bacterium]|nr:PQQ-like beta-propeller repeat protein [Phycisphaerae bacterium]
MPKQALIIALIVMIAAGSVCVAGDWPHFRGPDRSGVSSEKGLMTSWPAAGPKMLWSYKGLGKGFASMTVVDGLIYTTGVEDKTAYIYAFDLDGQLKWKQPCGPGWTGSYPGSRTTPTVDGDRLYIMSGQGRIACHNAKTGREIWKVETTAVFGGRNITWGFAESPLIDGQKVICTPGGPDASVVALDKMTGKTLWTSKGLSDKSAYCTPLLVEIGPNRLLFTMLAESIVGLDVETGKVHWQVPHKVNYDISAVSPVYTNGILYVTNNYGKGSIGFTLTENGTKCEKKWSDKTLDCHHGGVMLVNGNIYGANGRGWVCQDPVTGAVKYQETLVGKGSGICVDGLFYLYGEKGDMALVKANPNGFETISTFKITLGNEQHWAHPVVANGVLYMRHGDTLMAFDIKAK